jgi:hypothetical protein
MVLTVAACVNASVSLAGRETTPSGSTTARPTSSAPAQQRQLPQGYRRVSDGTHSISFGLPTTFTTIDITKLEKSGTSDPAMQVQIQRIKEAGGIFLADNESRKQSPNNFMTNVVAFCSSAPSTSIEEWKASAQKELQLSGATNIQISDTTLGGIPGIRMTYVLDKTTVMENAVLKNGKICDVTLTTDQPARYQKVFDQITATTQIS